MTPGMPVLPSLSARPLRRRTRRSSWNMAGLQGKSITTSPGSRESASASWSSSRRRSGPGASIQGGRLRSPRSAAVSSAARFGRRRALRAGSQRRRMRSATAPPRFRARRPIRCRSSSSVGPASSRPPTSPAATASLTMRAQSTVPARTAWCQYTLRNIWYLANSRDSSAVTAFSSTPTSNAPLSGSWRMTRPCRRRSTSTSP